MQLIIGGAAVNPAKNRIFLGGTQCATLGHEARGYRGSYAGTRVKHLCITGKGARPVTAAGCMATGYSA